MDETKQAALNLLGNDIRKIREAAGFTQQQLADLFGWGRDAVCKLEAGKISISLYDYLTIMTFLYDECPDHPAHELGRLFKINRRRRKLAA